MSEDELNCSHAEKRVFLADDKQREVPRPRVEPSAKGAALVHQRTLEVRTPRVLVALDSSATWSRDILRGFARVAHEQGWTLLHYQATANLESLAAELHPSAAVLGPPFHGPWPERLRGCVSVAINADRGREGIASVLVEEDKIADLAAAHFMTRGFRTLTTVRFEAWGAGRERRFREVAARLGARLEPGWGADAAAHTSSDERPTAFIAWLTALPKPCGIFTCCDAWGRMLAHYAYVAKLRVPEDVALLGVDNDVFECEITAPPAWLRNGVERFVVWVLCLLTEALAPSEGFEFPSITRTGGAREMVGERRARLPRGEAVSSCAHRHGQSRDGR